MVEFDNDRFSATEADQFAVLESKIAILIDQLKRLKQENGELIRANDEAQQKLASQSKEFNALKQSGEEWKQTQQQVRERIKSLIERIEGAEF